MLSHMHGVHECGVYADTRVCFFSIKLKWQKFLSGCLADIDILPL